MSTQHEAVKPPTYTSEDVDAVIVKLSPEQREAIIRESFGPPVSSDLLEMGLIKRSPNDKYWWWSVLGDLVQKRLVAGLSKAEG